MLRFALFGAGFIGQVHGANLATNPRTKLHYIYDVNAEAAHKLASRFSATVAASVEEIFAAEDVDAVLIASSTNTHADRIWHVHFKDHNPAVAAQAKAEGWDAVTAVGKGLFCELGKGDVDFPAILAELKRMGYNGWIVVEQDVLPGMGSPKESAARNRAYIRSIGL